MVHEQSMHVLLVEDDEDDYLIVCDLVEQIEHPRVELEWVRTWDEAIQRVERADYDAVLTDYRLGADTGLDLLQAVQEHGSSAPVILLTGHGDRQVDLQAMDAGAADYLIKGEITPQMLERSLRYATQQHSLLMQLRALSLTDELTGLYNRRGFQMLGEPQLKLARRGGRETLLLFVDLDGMKRINDRLGHEAGDEALRETAELLRRTFRSSDVCARLGGDEFAVLAADAPIGSATTITERVSQNLEALNATANRSYQLSLSIGEVRCSPTDSRSLDELLRWADEAMYERKSERCVDAT